jgi:predicted nucleic acid-binding protein
MALFDTDILIDFLRGHDGAKNTLLSFSYEKNYCSVITIGEVLFGMRENEKDRTLSLFDNLIELDVSPKIIRRSYEIKKRAKGYQLQLIDCIIAATALEENLILVTHNAKHYPDKELKLFVPEY